MAKKRQSQLKGFSLPEPEEVKKEVATVTGQTESKEEIKAPVLKRKKMGRPKSDHKRKPFTSRCNPNTWAKLKMLATVENKEVGELVEAAFSAYLKKNGSKVSDFLNN